jgi:hypothetical protein
MKSISFKLPFRFHTKIFLVLGAMVCLSILSVLFILQEATENRIQENIRERFQESRAAFRHLQNLRRQFTVDAIDNLTNSNAQFRSILSTASLGVDELGLAKSEGAGALYKDDNLRLNSLLPFLSMYHEFDLLILTTADGTLLFSKASSQRFGDDISDLPLFEQFEVSQEAEDVWYSGASGAKDFLIPAQAGNAAYYVIAKPVEFRDEFHGVVICGKRMDRDPNKARSLQHFEAGLKAYRRREWKAAASQFEQVLDLVPEDTPSKVYVQRCNEYLKTPPANDWDGVYELRAK